MHNPPVESGNSYSARLIRAGQLHRDYSTHATEQIIQKKKYRDAKENNTKDGKKKKLKCKTRECELGWEKCGDGSRQTTSRQAKK